MSTIPLLRHWLKTAKVQCGPQCPPGREAVCGKVGERCTAKSDVTDWKEGYAATTTISMMDDKTLTNSLKTKT